MKAIDLHHWLEQELPNPVPQDHVDGISAGNPETEVRGVAVTWLPNLDVLRRAAAGGLNFIIGHEPAFYHHPWDYPKGDWYQIPMPEEDLAEKMATPPGLEKQRLIKENDLVT
jgi:putative NIF3 family GTP cyclohydrolase 1 type 2